MTWAQNPKHDTLRYILHTDQFGVQKKVRVVYPTEILIIDGDSVYTVLNEDQLQKIIESQGGFNIISNPDSVSLFLQKKFKAIIILKKDKEKH